MNRAGSRGGSSATGIAGTGGRAFFVVSVFFVRLLFFREVEAADASGILSKAIEKVGSRRWWLVSRHISAGRVCHVGAFSAWLI